MSNDKTGGARGDRPVHTRLATSADLDALADIYARCLTGAPGNEQWTPAAARAFLQMWLERRPELFFVAEVDGVLVGGNVGDIKPYFDGNRFTDGEMFVEPAVRHLGIARLLMQRSIETACRVHNVVAKETLANGNSQVVLDWFLRLGFERTGWVHMEAPIHVVRARLGLDAAPEKNAGGNMTEQKRVGTIGLIGSGNIGGTVARLAIAAGYDVVLSNSRGPASLSELVRELGPRARAATPAEAAAAGDLVVVTVPLHAYRSVPTEPLAGKIVLDTNNYYPDRDGRIAELDSGSTTVSELLQRHLGSAKVVKAFNNIYFKHLLSLARPTGAKDRSALPIAGDDAEAKATVTAFLDSIGYGAVDAGPLAEGWRFERDTPAYAFIYFQKNVAAGGIPDGAPADAATVRAALDAARRSPAS